MRSDNQQKGAQIIHAPSDTMEFYEDFEQRQMMQNLAHSEMPTPLDLPDPPPPIDASDGGCDDDPQCEAGGPWTQQDPIIEIEKVMEFRTMVKRFIIFCG